MAQSSQKRKIQEYRDMRSRHQELSQQIGSSTHDEDWDGYRNMVVCNNGCKACNLKRQASALEIAIFEWPLPSDVLLSKAIVFEITVPKAVVV